MKTLKTMMAALMLTIAASAQAMTYSEAREQALYLADKMAYELYLTEEQYEAAYEINLDYLMAIESPSDLYGIYWRRRNLELQSIMADWQYDAYLTAEYFYRPVYWSDNTWNYLVYDYYRPTRFYYVQPKVYVTYRGGNRENYYTSRSWTHPTTKVLRTGNHSYGNGKRLSAGNSDNRSFGNGSRNSSTTTTRTTTTTTTTTTNRNFGNGSRVSTSSNPSTQNRSTLGRIANRQTATNRQSAQMNTQATRQSSSASHSFGGNRQTTTARSTTTAKATSGAIGGHR